MWKQTVSGGLNMPQERTSNNEEYKYQSGELSEEELDEDPSEEPDEYLSQEPNEDPSEEHGMEPSGEPPEEPLSQPFCDNAGSDEEHQSKSIQAGSSGKKGSVEVTAGHEDVSPVQLQKRYKQVQFMNNTLENDGNASEGQEKSSSEKRRRSRWDLQQKGDDETVEADGDGKRRTRWASDDSQLKKLAPILLPDFVNLVSVDRFEPEIQDLYIRLLVLNKKLQGSSILDDRPGEERSPSPPPVYNTLGIRINSRDVRFRERLIQERQDIISRLIQKNTTSKPPSDYKPPKLIKKLYIPIKEYPGHNFIGLIIGPRGKTLKRMEKKTRARIYLRGKGSVKRDMKPDPSENEDLHVLVEAKSQKSLDAAVGMVEKLLAPMDNETNELKRVQLKELAEMNGKLKCNVCGDSGHMQYVCPNKNSMFKMDTLCQICGDGGHQTASCPLTASDPSSKMDDQYHSFLSDIASVSEACGVSPISNSISWTENPALPGSFCGSSSSTGTISTAAARDKSKKEIDDSNLYVGHLPSVMDDKQLMQLFSPFGQIMSAELIKDRTTGLTKGYGFVRYTDPANAAKAVERMNGHKIDGKTLAVRVAGCPSLAPLSLGSVGTTAISPLPQYPAPPSLSRGDSPGCSAWPGPPGSMLPETCTSSPYDDVLGLPSGDSVKTDSFNRHLPYNHVSSYHVPISSSSISQFPVNLAGSPNYLRQSDSVNKQLPLCIGSSAYKIPISASSTSQISGNPRSSPSYLGQSDLFNRHSLSSYGAPDYLRQNDSVNKQLPLCIGSSAYKIPISASNTSSQISGNPRGSPSYLGQSDLFNRHSLSSYGAPDYLRRSDSVNKELPLCMGSSAYKIPISASSTFSQISGNPRSSPSYLGQSDLFNRHSLSSHGPSYQSGVSLASGKDYFPGYFSSSSRYFP